MVTRDPRWAAAGAERAGSVADALEIVAESGVAWAIGGGEVYRAALEHATVLSVTEVDVTADGDVRAPAVETPWRVSEDTGWRLWTAGPRYPYPP